MKTLETFFEDRKLRELAQEQGLERDAAALGINIEDLPADYQQHPLYKLGEASVGWIYKLERDQQAERYQRQLETLRSMIDMLLENIPK